MATNGSQNAAATGPTAEDFASRAYDYVIVGGGTAGLVLAARLTENPDVHVAVLEAGKNKLGDPLVDTPALFTQMLGDPEYEWGFRTVAQKGNRGLVHHLPRGKVLGRSSGINYMMYVRGSDADYDDWATIVGDDAWSSKNMKQYMRKHQTLEPIDDAITDRSTMPFVGENHGTSGPVRTSFNDNVLPIQYDVIKACDEASGMTKKPVDPWSGDHIGFFNTLGAIVRTGPNKGKRSYAARGYYEANKERPNLHVLCEALVTKVELDGDTAVGAYFQTGGQNYFTKATREVIVSCGVIQSPQILELSGIGDPAVLSAAGVECKVQLPAVGENLQDHAVSGQIWEFNPGHISGDVMSVPEVLADAQKQLMEKQGGPLTGIPDTQGFFPYTLFSTEEERKEVVQSILDIKDQTDFQKRQRERVIAHINDPKSANLQFVFLPITLDLREAVSDQSKMFPRLKPSDPMGMAIGACLQYPVARGSVHIKSSDPKEHPSIDPGFLEHSADVAVLGGGMKFLDAVTKAPSLADKLSKRTLPDPKLDCSKTEDARAAVQEWMISEYHACGSCAMGDAVDARLRVKGVKKLRVVDASVFPNHVSGNICSSVYALAEKAADLIKEDWDRAT